MKINAFQVSQEARPVKRIAFDATGSRTVYAIPVILLAASLFPNWAHASPTAEESLPTKTLHSRVPATIVKDLKTGYFREALSKIEPDMASHSDNADYQERYAQSLLGVGKYRQALRAIKKAVATAPRKASYYRVMGEIYGALAQNANIFSAMGLARHVLDSFRTAVKIDPHDPKSLMDLGKYYIDAPGIVGGNIRKAHKVEATLDKIEPLDALLLRAHEAVNAHNYEKAEGLLQRAASLDHSSHSSRILGFLYMRRHRYIDELKTFRSITKQEPDDIRAWYWVGRASIASRSDYAEGIHALKHYIAAPRRPDTAPSLAFAHLRLGDLFRLTGKDYLACTQYAKAKKAHGSHSRKFNLDLGKSLRKLRASNPHDREAITSREEFSRADCS